MLGIKPYNYIEPTATLGSFVPIALYHLLSLVPENMAPSGAVFHSLTDDIRSATLSDQTQRRDRTLPEDLGDKVSSETEPNCHTEHDHSWSSQDAAYERHSVAQFGCEGALVASNCQVGETGNFFHGRRSGLHEGLIALLYDKSTRRWVRA